jgi:Concanavalin A-like lectin/glucanases superfamily
MSRFFTLLVISIGAAVTCFSQTEIVWKLDNLKKIGGVEATVVGDPRVTRSNEGKAILFDGTDDGVFLETNPVENAKAFTVEAIFRPDGGNKEQRWFHIQQDDADNRVLLEIRVIGDEWFLDTFIKSGENRLTHYAENFKHKIGAWYHVALVFDGSEMRHYVDGKLELAGKLAITPFGKGKTSLGVRQNKVHWFKGAIRRVRITKFALLPAKFMKK